MADIHAKIMNIPCELPDVAGLIPELAYKMGHRDARHAAAELALTSDLLPRWHRIDDPDHPAPRDGMWFFGWQPRNFTSEQFDTWAWSENNDDFHGFVNSHDSNEAWEQPTHWQPLPAPPEAD